MNRRGGSLTPAFHAQVQRIKAEIGVSDMPDDEFERCSHPALGFSNPGGFC